MATATANIAGILFEGDAIYLDYAAATPCDPRVVEAMLPFLSQSPGNPLQPHRPGRAAAQAMDLARSEIAALFGPRVESGQVCITSSATEANNLAILGVAGITDRLALVAGAGGAAPPMPARRRIVVTAVEHASVLAPARHLAALGFELVEVPVDGDGVVRLDHMQAAIDDDTLLVSVQAANNELGVVQPVREIGRMARRAGALLHVDAVQAAGKVAIDVDSWGADMVTLSGHKMCGPKGVGALYVRAGAHARALHPLLFGGGQERGLSPGTSNVPAVVGLGAAACIARQSMVEESRRVRWLRDRLEQRFAAAIPGIRINGQGVERVPGISSVELPRGGPNGAALLAAVPRVACAGASACSAHGVSHVLREIGRRPGAAERTLRFAVGRFSTPHEVDDAVELLARGFRELCGVDASLDEPGGDQGMMVAGQYGIIEP